ncbi:MAG: hypothetical protein M0P94_01370 [Candidatus Absconditabacterales bacterium]|nr:hypothetical protein [Candidatus Absconditabacterales bacterium]
MKKIKKKDKLRAYLGFGVIVLGFLVFTAGKPNPIDPKIIDPTWQTMLIGGLVMIIGYLVGRKSFKSIVSDSDIK